MFTNEIHRLTQALVDATSTEAIVEILRNAVGPANLAEAVVVLTDDAGRPTEPTRIADENDSLVRTILPLRVGERVYGSLVCPDPPEGRTDPERDAFLRIVANLGAMALDRVRLTEENRQERIDRRAAEEAMREREARFDTLFAAVDEGYCLCEMIVDADGNPVDYRFLEINPLFESMTGLRNPVGRTALELVPGLERFWVETYARVGLGGETIRFESHSLPMERWFDVFATPVRPHGRFLLLFKNITERKLREEERGRLLAEIQNRQRLMNDRIATVPGVVWEAWGEPDAADQRINFVSDYVESLLGYTVEEWMSTPNFWLSIVHPDDREGAANRARYAWEHLQTHINPFRWVTRDGRSIPVETHSMVIRNADGQPIGMRGVTLDVSERHRASEALRLSEARLAGIIASATDAILCLDEQHRLVVFNRAAERVFGCPASEVLGQTIDRFLPAATQEGNASVLRLFEESDASGNVSPGLRPLTALRSNGEAFPIEATVSRAEAGGQKLLTVILRDITERQQTEARIHQLNNRLHRAIFESSHRIKNQLQLLAATVDMVLMNGEERISAEEFRRFATQIRTLSVLQDILTLEWKADVNVVTESISSQGMLERVLEIFRETARRHRLTFRIDDTPLTMRTATTLALITNEAASNAIKHGRQTVEVTFRVGDGDGSLEISDDGPGFPDGFNPETSANTGLDLIASLVEFDLNGTVLYENRSEGGARVLIRFPLTQAAAT
ncbi:MAG: PAS domain S-box protein [Capsulimonadales bacterium]|nr:PAS domain S-box protein [Capsulimonadales bacterium]